MNDELFDLGLDCAEHQESAGRLVLHVFVIVSDR